MHSSGSDDDHSNQTGASEHYAERIDARGLRCPMPLLRAKQALNRVAPGSMVQVLASDAGAARDFPSFAQLSGHELLRQVKHGSEFEFVLKKREESGA